MDMLRFLGPLLIILFAAHGFLPVQSQDNGQNGDQVVVQGQTTDFSIPPSDDDGQGMWVPVTAPGDASNSTSNGTDITGVSNLDGVTADSSNVTASSLDVTTESLNGTTTTSDVTTSGNNSTSPATNSSTNTSTASSSNSTGSSDAANGNNTATQMYTSVGVVVAAVFVAVF